MFNSFATIPIDHVDQYYSHEFKAIVGRFPRLIDDDEVNKYFGSLCLEDMVNLADNNPSYKVSTNFSKLKDRMPWLQVGPGGYVVNGDEVFEDQDSPYNVALKRMYTFLKKQASRHVDWSVYAKDDEHIAALFHEPQLKWTGTRFRLDYRFGAGLYDLRVERPPYRGLVTKVFSYTTFKPKRRPSQDLSRAILLQQREPLYHSWLAGGVREVAAEWDLGFLSGPYLGSKGNIVEYLPDSLSESSTGQEKLNSIKTTLVESVIRLEERAQGRSSPILDIAKDQLDVFFELV